VVVDKEGTIVVADCKNGRLRKIVGRQVTTLAGGSEAGTADGAGAGARFNEPVALALDERGRLLVAEYGRADTLRVVDASLAPPVWMGPVDALQAEKDQAFEKLQEECAEEFKPLPKPVAGKEYGDKDGKKDTPVSSEESGGGEEKSDKDDSSPKKDDEYKIINLKLTEEDLAKFSITLPEHGEEMGKTGINFEPVGSSENHWDITDYSKFIVVDYPKSLGHERYLTPTAKTKEFLKEYETRVEPKLISQENFAQQVRKLIQIRSKSQMQYGVKKGKLDQSRLSRICFNAPGFNERVFKNKIENKLLDAAITVLVDMSGSMSGQKVFNALASTLLVNEVCSTLNIPLEIIGFTDGYSSTFGGIKPIMYVYKSFSDLKVSSDSLREYFAYSSNHMSGNPDGENILWAYDRLAKRKERKKLLIVMSDGSPAASKSCVGIGEFTHKVIEEIEASKSVDIYGLGLCSDSVQYYYKAHSVVSKPEEIPSKLIELIERKIVNGS
jgi:cobalamin biosynthesis protein CobT